MIFARRCRRCGEIYDIGINYVICPTCRMKEKEIKKEERNGNRTNGRRTQETL